MVRLIKWLYHLKTGQKSVWKVDVWISGVQYSDSDCALHLKAETFDHQTFKWPYHSKIGLSVFGRLWFGIQMPFQYQTKNIQKMSGHWYIWQSNTLSPFSSIYKSTLLIFQSGYEYWTSLYSNGQKEVGCQMVLYSNAI